VLVQFPLTASSALQTSATSPPTRWGEVGASRTFAHRFQLRSYWLGALGNRCERAGAPTLPRVGEEVASTGASPSKRVRGVFRDLSYTSASSSGVPSREAQAACSRSFTMSLARRSVSNSARPTRHSGDRFLSIRAGTERRHSLNEPARRPRSVAGHEIGRPVSSPPAAASASVFGAHGSTARDVRGATSSGSQLHRRRASSTVALQNAGARGCGRLLTGRPIRARDRRGRRAAVQECRARPGPEWKSL